ncbi:MAG: MFS transporter [Acidobacteria bacterium]|nr:MFS transporter [Acidobacteriota bacterium]
MHLDEVSARTMTAPQVSPGPTRLWPWMVCLFLMGATGLSYLDRQALSVVAPVVRAELAIDNARLGLLLSAFFYSYALMQLAVGWILDRFNIRFTYGAFVALWSLAQIGCGLARDFAGLFTARLFLGGFEAAGQCGAARIIARIVGPRDRALANGIMMSGGSLGAAVAPVLMIWLANSIGWRSGFAILGAAGLVWATAWIAWFRPPVALMQARAGAGPLEAAAWGTVFRSQRFWACAGGAAFTIPIIHIASAWIPTYFVQTWNLPLSAGLGAYLFFIYMGLDFGFIGGGALVKLLANRGWTVPRARKAVMAASAALMLAAAAVPLAGSVRMAVVLVFLLNLGRASWGALFLAFNQDVAPARVGTIAGIMGCIGSLSGALMVWTVGIVSKASGFGTSFVMISVLAVLGTAAMLSTRWED